MLAEARVAPRPAAKLAQAFALDWGLAAAHAGALAAWVRVLLRDEGGATSGIAFLLHFPVRDPCSCSSFSSRACAHAHTHAR